MVESTASQRNRPFGFAVPLLAGLLSALLSSCSSGTATSVITCGSSTAVPPGSNPLNISRSTCGSGSPAFTQAGGNLYVAWVQPAGATGIYFSRSADNGASFSAPLNLSGGTGTPESPAVAAAGSNVFVVWDAVLTSPSAEVYLRQSSDGGLTFGASVQISNAAGLTAGPTAVHSARSPAVAAVGNTVWIAWEDDVSNIANPPTSLALQSEILASVSTNGGQGFAPLPKGISYSSSVCAGGTTVGMFSQFPTLTASGTSLYALWQENTPVGCQILPTSVLLSDILFSQAASASPATFAAPQSVAQVGQRGSNAAFGVMAASGSDVYVAWSELETNGNTDVYYNASADGGTNFMVFCPPPPPIPTAACPKNVSNPGDLVRPVSSGSPSLDASGSNVAVVWSDSRPTLAGIAEIKSTDGGSTFSSPVNVSQTGGSTNQPKVLMSLPNLHLIWVDSSQGASQIVYRTLTF